MKEIILCGKYGKGKKTIVSDEDFVSLNKFKWYLQKDQRTSGLFYVFSYYKSNGNLKFPSRVFMHRKILGDRIGYYVDHKDRNTLNNTRHNLRHATPKESTFNRTLSPHPESPSGVKPGSGVGYTLVGNKYQVMANRKYLGLFKTKREARREYLNYYNKGAML